MAWLGRPASAPDAQSQRSHVCGGSSFRGNFITSRIAIGTSIGVDNIFGTEDDTFLGTGDPAKVSTLGSLTIKGWAYGTPASVNSGDSFAVLAEKIGRVIVGKTVFSLPTGPGIVPLGPTSDLFIIDNS